MKNKAVKIVVSLVILGVLCGAYFGVQNYVKRQENEENEQQEEETNEVFSVESDDIHDLTFLVDKKEVTFIKEDDTWYKDDEREFPVDQDVLSGAASSISLIEADRVLENVEDLSEYELDSPQNTITVETGDGEKTVIRVGMENDSTNQYYISLNDDRNTVYVVESNLVEPYLKSLYDYAKSGEFPLTDSSSISYVSVEKGDTSYQFEKDPDTNLWYVDDGENHDKADSTKMETLTGAIGSLTYEEFVDYHCTDESKYGFNNPYAVLKVKYQEEVPVESDDPEDQEDDSTEAAGSDENNDTSDETTDSEPAEETDEESSASDETSSEDEEEETELVEKELTLYIGDEYNDNRYVKLDGSNEVYALAIGTISGLTDRDISYYWDLAVNYLSVNQLQSVEVVTNNETHTINVSRETSETEDDEDDSSVTTTLKYDLDGVDLEENSSFLTFYNKLNSLTAQERLTESYNPDEDPDMTVNLTDIDGNMTKLEFYEYDVNFYAVLVNEKVYLINKMTYRELMDSYSSFISGDEEAASEA